MKNMKQKLEELANQVETEIRETGRLIVAGIPSQRSSDKTKPWKGLCRPAVEKLIELAPELKIKRLAFNFGNGGFDTHNHIIGQVHTTEGLYKIDPTVRQYLPEAQLVYGPQDVYPLKIHPRSLRIF